MNNNFEARIIFFSNVALVQIYSDGPREQRPKKKKNAFIHHHLSYANSMVKRWCFSINHARPISYL